MSTKPASKRVQECLWPLVKTKQNEKQTETMKEKRFYLVDIHLFDKYLLSSLWMPTPWLDHELQDYVPFVCCYVPNTWYSTWHIVGTQQNVQINSHEDRLLALTA